MNTVRIFNKKLENIKETQSEMKNLITEIKNTLEGVNRRLTDVKEWISDLEDRIMENHSIRTTKRKTNCKKWKVFKRSLE